MLAVLRAAIAARRPHRPPVRIAMSRSRVRLASSRWPRQAAGCRWYSPQLARSAQRRPRQRRRSGRTTKAMGTTAANGKPDEWKLDTDSPAERRWLQGDAAGGDGATRCAMRLRRPRVLQASSLEG